MAGHESGSETAKVGPGLKGLFSNPAHKLPSGKDHRHTEAAVRELIEKGSDAMPPMGEVLSSQEMDDILAYLHTL